VNRVLGGVWNPATASWVAGPETARSVRVGSQRAVAVLVAAPALLAAGSAQAAVYNQGLTTETHATLTLGAGDEYIVTATDDGRASLLAITGILEMNGNPTTTVQAPADAVNTTKTSDNIHWRSTSDQT